MNERLVRFLISVPGALCVAFLYNQVNHTAYYKTIFSVQTADFNLLANTLPTKLSQALQRKDLEEVQRTLNSNFGLFGVVVTDCKSENKECDQQKIVAVTQPKRSGWRDKITLNNLSIQPYDVLRDQLPTTAQWGFKDARSTEIIPTGRLNQGKPIGRVYYIRRDPPNFIQDQINWVSTPVRSLQTLMKLDAVQAGSELQTFFDSGANKYYFLTNLLGLVVGIGGWRAWEQFVRERRLQQAANDRKEGEYRTIIETMRGKLDDEQEIARVTNEQLDILLQSVDREVDQQKEINRELESRNRALEENEQSLVEELQAYKLLDEEIQQYQSLKDDNQSLREEIDKLNNELSQQKQIEYGLCSRNDQREQVEQALRNENARLEQEIQFLKEKGKVSTATEALQAAANRFPILEIWKSASDSAAKIDNDLSDKVYSKLEVLAEVGKAYLEGRVGKDLQAVFSSKGVKYTPDETDATMARFGSERTFSQDGRRFEMVRHIRVGRKFRIHFEFDESERRIVVGYCGKHLRNNRG